MAINVQYSKIQSYPHEWKNLEQIQIDMDVARRDEAGIEIKGEVYSVEGIANRIFSFRPNSLPDESPQGRAYLAVTKKFKAIKGGKYEHIAPFFRHVTCCCSWFCVTSFCKQSVLLADAELTEDDLAAWQQRTAEI